MQKYPIPLPDSDSLAFGLSKVFNENGFAEGKIKVLDRQPNIHTSTFPSEIVTCLLQNGRTLQIFCKYGSNKYFGRKGDVYYESHVYRNILQPLNVSSPVYYGFHNDEKEDDKWLFLEYIDRAFCVSKTEGADPMIQAAGWIGRFHAATESNLSKTSKEFLLSHDLEFYLGLTRRTLLYSGHYHHRFAWLSTLCGRFDEMAASLSTNRQTVIHGEYFPRNILYQDGVIRPVDWQTTTIAAGEIDLASLIDGWWSPEIVFDCEREYQRTRWPEHVPEDFRQVMNAARLYQQFRYLGSHFEWEKSKRYMSRRYERLKIVGERMGFI